MPTVSGDNNTVYAGAGHDVIYIEGTRFEDHWNGVDPGEAGSFYHESIFNTYTYSGGFNNVFGEDGNDTIYAYCGANTIDAGSGNDIIRIPKSYQTQSYDSDQYHSVYIQESFKYENGGNSIFAGSGNDSIYAEGEPCQSIGGGTGNDYLYIDNTSFCVYVDGELGNDTIMAYGGYETLAGGADNDVILVQQYGEGRSIDGGDGNDTIQLAAVGGRADLGGGTHTVIDGISQTLLNFENAIGSAVAEEIVGSSVGNRLEGRGGNDSLFGMDGDDIVFGGEGDDLLNGGTGLDVIDGGAGNDTASYNGGTLAGSINLSTGKAVFGGVTETLINIENASGSYGADTVIGSEAANVLRGFAGNDMLLGLGSDDTLLGDVGNDTLDGGAGADSMSGGAGNDLYRINTATDIVIEAAGGGIDTVESSVTRTLGATQENLTLTGAAAISGTGNELANTLTGNVAANRLSGGLGGDTMLGGSGNDWLAGGAIADRLTGGIGNDTFEGGSGTDTLVWTGARFSGGDVGAGVFETVIGGAGDRLDFTAGLEGLLRVDGATLSGAAANVVIGGSLVVGSTNLRFSAAAGVLQFDLDGNGTFTTADFQIALPSVDSVVYVAAGDYFLLG